MTLMTLMPGGTADDENKSAKDKMARDDHHNDTIKGVTVAIVLPVAQMWCD